MRRLLSWGRVRMSLFTATGNDHAASCRLLRPSARLRPCLPDLIEKNLKSNDQKREAEKIDAMLVKEKKELVLLQTDHDGPTHSMLTSDKVTLAIRTSLSPYINES